MTRDRWVRSTSLRGLAAASVFLSLLTAAPAGAASSVTSLQSAAAVTHIAVRAAPATVHVGSAVVVSGTVNPRVAGVPVVLQRLVGSRWVSLRSVPVSATGTFSFSQRATAPTARWQLRVARIAAKGVPAGASAPLPVRVTTAIFAVRAALAASSVATGSPVVVTGSVTPRATGTVFLQRLQGRVWRNVTTARLTSTSTYRLSTVLPAGGYRLRVVRPFSATVADGASPALAVTVLAPPGVTVTTATLPIGTVGRRYTATLAATGGTAPYTWTAISGIPAGMAVSSDGRLWGYPTSAGKATVRVAARNAQGGTGTANLAVTIAPAPAGKVRAWGGNAYGALGSGAPPFPKTAIPGPVSMLTDVTAISGGSDVGYAVQSDGTLWAWGSNFGGLLGNGSTAKASNEPVVGGLAGVTAVAGGTNAAYALRSDGSVWAWGTNREGELGNGTTDPSDDPGQISTLTRVVAIAAGYVGGYALRADGTVWAWGDNGDGQLGTGSPAPRSLVPVQITLLKGITAIASNGWTGYALRADGTVWSWGDGGRGQIGNGVMKDTSTPVQVSGLAGVTAIAAAYTNGYALRADGSVVAWGDNTSGQLGNGTKNPRLAPAQVGSFTGVTAIAANSDNCYVITTGGAVYAWGDNGMGQLGSGGYDPWLVPVRVSGLTAVLVAVGLRTAYAVVAP